MNQVHLKYLQTLTSNYSVSYCRFYMSTLTLSKFALCLSLHLVHNPLRFCFRVRSFRVEGGGGGLGVRATAILSHELFQGGIQEVEGSCGRCASARNMACIRVAAVRSSWWIRESDFLRIISSTPS